MSEKEIKAAAMSFDEFRYIPKCIAMALLDARAERDLLLDEVESERIRVLDLADDLREATAERDALRKRLHEWVQWGDRMASGHPDAPMASLDHEVRDVIANRYGMSILDAALSVQPTTSPGEDK